MDLFPNETVLFQWFLFVTAFFALHFGVFRPVLHLIRERKELTEGAREKAQELTRRAGELLQDWELKIRGAREKGARDRESLLQEGEARQSEILDAVRAEGTRKLETLRGQLEKKQKEVSLQLRQYGQEMGREIVETLLGRGI